MLSSSVIGFVFCLPRPIRKKIMQRALYKRCIKYKIMCMGDSHTVFLRAHAVCYQKLEKCAHKNQCILFLCTSEGQLSTPERIELKWKRQYGTSKVFQQDHISFLIITILFLFMGRPTAVAAIEWAFRNSLCFWNDNRVLSSHDAWRLQVHE